MSHWLLETLGDGRAAALSQAGAILIRRELLAAPPPEDFALIRRTSEVLELAALDLLLGPTHNDGAALAELRLCAADAFRLLRALPPPEDPLEAALFKLRACALAVLGDMGSDAARSLRESPWPELPLRSNDWSVRTWSAIADVWLRLIRKQGWEDRDRVLECVATLRGSQAEFEAKYLRDQQPARAKSAALELIGLYHLAKAGEILARYMTDGVVDGHSYQIHQLLEMHFDRALAVCRHARMVDLEPLARLLAACSSQMADNSIWTVTRAHNSRVTEFVQSLVSRGRGDRALFDVLPPQRKALAEKGLLGSSRRAVVVTLPTSSGKTLIAEFRILQALNQFEHDRGWVAYVAPTRALVNQITRQLRLDFEALPHGIVVEQVSPALEIDTVETRLLHERDEKREFRVLVTTPEKLDLMLRQGLEQEVDRPLTLVVVDEAHDIQDPQRGLRLELLLATINNECKYAQFLLLTPFIDNAREVAQWLGGVNSDDVSFSVDWQPNDRVIGVVQAKQGAPLKRHGSFDYYLELETVHTSRPTLAVDDALPIPKNAVVAPTLSKVSNASCLAAITGQYLRQRGPVILMHDRPDHVWTLAETLKGGTNTKSDLPKEVALAKEFLELEYGPRFALNSLLTYGIGVHHSGLSHDVRALVEWLFEQGKLDYLVATTTIAKGVNFPVTGLVMASHQYPTEAGPSEMPPEDFWNIAGRAGRVGQGSLGVVALIAADPKRAARLKQYVKQQTGVLNSALIALAGAASDELTDLKQIVSWRPEWSTFVQYLVHTYRQMGEPADFVDQIEQVLRGTFGFEELRRMRPELAARLLVGIRAYTEYLSEPHQPLKLVDSTGFSLQSIKSVLASANEEGIRSTSWNPMTLFRPGNTNLKKMMGVLLRVPELRRNLEAAVGGERPDGQKLALIVKDWVNGTPIPDIAKKHFKKEGDDDTTAITHCGTHLFGKLGQTASWGLGALLSITGGGLPEDEFAKLRELPSRVYYGVNTESAIALRLLGVPRGAAPALASEMGDEAGLSLPEVRSHLREMDDGRWAGALGEHEGRVYRAVWRVLEGLQ